MTLLLNIRCLGPALLLAFCCLAGCAADERPVQMGGAIFGTTWSLTYLGAPDEVSPAQVQSEIDAAFALVNESMNHYDPASLISEFNSLPAQRRSRSTGISPMCCRRPSSSLWRPGAPTT